MPMEARSLEFIHKLFMQDRRPYNAALNPDAAKFVTGDDMMIIENSYNNRVHM